MLSLLIEANLPIDLGGNGELKRDPKTMGQYVGAREHQAWGIPMGPLASLNDSELRAQF